MFEITLLILLLVHVTVEKKTPYIKQTEIDAEPGKFKPNLDYNYTFPIYLVLKGIPFGVKSIEKRVITIQIWFDLTRFESDKAGIKNG